MATIPAPDDEIHIGKRRGMRFEIDVVTREGVVIAAFTRLEQGPRWRAVATRPHSVGGEHSTTLSTNHELDALLASRVGYLGPTFIIRGLVRLYRRNLMDITVPDAVLIAGVENLEAFVPTPSTSAEWLQLELDDLAFDLAWFVVANGAPMTTLAPPFVWAATATMWATHPACEVLGTFYEEYEAMRDLPRIPSAEDVMGARRGVALAALAMWELRARAFRGAEPSRYMLADRNEIGS